MGKEAMYRLLSISDNTDECIPTVIQIDKDDVFFGDIVLICTDGIYSFDQVPIGKLKDGSVWISGEKTMSLFYESLNQYFENNYDNLTDESLQIATQAYLEQLKNGQVIDDDATIGILITSKALIYQKKYQNQVAGK